MKFIDSEKLIAYIERRKEKYRNTFMIQNPIKVAELDDLLNVISSLQQDHLPDVGKMVEQEHIADVSKMIEQSEVDFEKFISDFIDKKDAENNGRWCEEDIIEAMTQSYKFGRKGGLEV